MASRGAGGNWLTTGTRLSRVDAPDLLEDEALLMRLRANNDALASLRAALDAESHEFAQFCRRHAVEDEDRALVEGNF